MITLNNLRNTYRPRKKVQRVGRGVGSKRGKTCCRGAKGDKARSGYKSRFGHEGGQLPLYRKLPCRGFDSKRFQSETVEINLSDIDSLFSDGEQVNLKTLRAKGYGPRSAPGGLRVLGIGELKKKVSVQANHFSKSAVEKLKKASVSFELLTRNKQ